MRAFSFITLLAGACMSSAAVTTIDFESTGTTDHPNGTVIQGVSFDNMSTIYGFWNPTSGTFRTHSGEGVSYFLDSPIVGTLVSGTAFDFSVWYTARYNDTSVELFLNGASVASVTGLAANTEAPAQQISFAGIEFDSFVLSGTANQVGFDDISFSSQAVPEPASMAALGLGGLALLRRRRKA